MGLGGLVFSLLTAPSYAQDARPTLSATDKQSLLAAPLQPPYQWFASTDSKHQNKDYLLLNPHETRRIPLATGRLARLWFTSGTPNKVTVSLSNGATTTLFSNGHPAQGNYYEKAWTLYPTTQTPVALRDLSAGAALVVVNTDAEPNKFFYQSSIRPPATSAALPVSPVASIISGSDGTIKPNGEYKYFLSYPGVVDEIEISLTPATPQIWNDVRLRVWWDEKSQASGQLATPTRPAAIDAPLAALAGQLPKGGAVSNALWTFDGKSLRLHAPMSCGYSDSALCLLKNSGGTEVKAHLRFTTHSLPPIGGMAAPPYYFCAVYGSAHTKHGQPVQMLKADGSGAFVGLSLGIEPVADSSRRSFAYLEGNETITADGKSYEGTGTEDFFNSAWYFPEQPFSHPYEGLTFKSKLPPQVAMYRLLIPDAVPFKKSLNFSFEHASRNSSDDLLYRWVAFWYQKPPLQFQVTDELAANPAASGSANTSAAGDGGATTQSKVPLLAALVAVIGVVAGVAFARATRRTRP